MSIHRVNYDEVAPTFDGRYSTERRRLAKRAIAGALTALAQGIKAGRVLEAGCGTGRWLAEWDGAHCRAFGLDFSHGMLAKAREQRNLLELARGDACRLPFAGETFDLVYCVNAFHHFDPPQDFVREARRLLRPGGALAIAGMEPRASRDSWYLYQYFEGTYETDACRFPPREAITRWMAEAGLGRIEWREVERVTRQHSGREVLDDFFLQKNGTSQLTLLTDEAYAAGMRRIESAVAEAEARGETILFPVDISITIIIGYALL
jgi:ubiquinone/menaquinone biosynthesis C-methylase UbiE